MSYMGAGQIIPRRVRRGFGDDLTTLVGDIAPITTAISAAENAPSSTAVSAATELIPIALCGFVLFLIIGAMNKRKAA